MSPEDQTWFYALQSHRRLIDHYLIQEECDINVQRLLEIGLWDSSSEKMGWQAQHSRCYAAVLGECLFGCQLVTEAKVRTLQLYCLCIIAEFFSVGTNRYQGAGGLWTSP